MHKTLNTATEVRAYYRPVPQCWHGWKPDECSVSAECRATATREIPWWVRAAWQHDATAYPEWH